MDVHACVCSCVCVSVNVSHHSHFSTKRDISIAKEKHITNRDRTNINSASRYCTSRVHISVNEDTSVVLETLELAFSFYFCCSFVFTSEGAAAGDVASNWAVVSEVFPSCEAGFKGHERERERALGDLGLSGRLTSPCFGMLASDIPREHDLGVGSGWGGWGAGYGVLC